MTRGALDGLVVLDLTQLLAGPFCTMMLADQGADVIKIESPEGDLIRTIGPFHSDDTQQCYGGYFQSINRNKRSIVLDLKSDRGCGIFKRLVRKADVVVENFRVGVMDRLGLSYEALSQENPRLVYASISGFGDPRTGESPYANWPSFDVVAQAMGGLMGITGPGTPMKTGIGIGDIVPGMYCAFGILAATRHAEKTGEGQFLNVAMYDAMLAICERIVSQYGYLDTVPGPEGNDHATAWPFTIFPVRDGWVAIACPIDHQWRTLIGIMGIPELADDARYITNAARIENKAAVTEIVANWTKDRSKSELAGLLGGRVPFGPVNDVSDIFADPHIASRNMLAEIDLPGISRPAIVANTPVHLQGTPGGLRTRAPRLGEHTAEVLCEFGLSEKLGEEKTR